MHDSLKEKINYEFEKFKIEKIRQSKAEIFAASYEIEAKKMIKRSLENIEVDRTTRKRLLSCPYLLDVIYLEMEKSRTCTCDSQGVQECIEWILR